MYFHSIAFFICSYPHPSYWPQRSGPTNLVKSSKSLQSNYIFLMQWGSCLFVVCSHLILSRFHKYRSRLCTLTCAHRHRTNRCMSWTVPCASLVICFVFTFGIDPFHIKSDGNLPVAARELALKIISSRASSVCDISCTAVSSSAAAAFVLP